MTHTLLLERNSMQKLASILLTLMLVVVTGCEQEPTTGDKIRDVGDAVGDAVEDVGDGIEDAADDINDNVNDATE